MKTIPIFAAFCLLILAGCSSNDGGNGDVGSEASEASDASAGGDIASEQDKNLCDWFAKLVEDVNAGKIRGTASAEPAMVGETLYRINNMYGLSLATHEPIPSAVQGLMSKARGQFEFEDLRDQINTLRDACAQLGLPVPELE
jgi:hypothetical protein